MRGRAVLGILMIISRLDVPSTLQPLFQRIRFLRSVHELHDLPLDSVHEVAFVGRSNAGKSSAINALAGARALARVSKTPGRTQLLNFFTVAAGRYLVDLPGYGYARAPERTRRHWQTLIEAYLRTRSVLRGVVLVMDVRRPLTDFDAQLLEGCRHVPLQVHVLLTKSDKLNRAAAMAALEETRKALERNSNVAGLQLFSATTRHGVEELRATLAHWLELTPAHVSGATDQTPG